MLLQQRQHLRDRFFYRDRPGIDLQLRFHTEFLPYPFHSPNSIKPRR